MSEMSPLRTYRKAKKMTLAALAKEVGITEPQLSRIERFGTTSLSRAISLSKATGLKPHDFLGPEWRDEPTGALHGAST